VPHATWSTCGDAECLRVLGVGPGARIAVWPSSALGRAGAPPSTAGTVVVDGDDLCFVPTFSFVEGSAYTVVVDGSLTIELVRPLSRRPPTAEVVDIRPAVEQVPRNLLRLYVEFNVPMSERQVGSHLAVVDDDGRPLAHAILVVVDELWDRERRRVTVLLDPSRIKRGLVPHRTLGYPLRIGEPFRVVVGEGFRDATGTPLRRSAERRYLVGPDQRGVVDPTAWTLGEPLAGTRDPVVATFDRALDEVLLSRFVRVERDGEAPVPGRAAVGPGARSWCFVPDRPWAAADHRLAIDARLEDLAGNSVAREFDRDLTGASAVPDGLPPGRVDVGFCPGSARPQ
jgi:hypothetical protein